MLGCTQIRLKRVPVVPFVLVATLSACSNDPKALYADPSAALPLLPFLPDAARISECEACAHEQCSAERDACTADPECAVLLQCRGKCNNPACLAGCGERTRWDFDRIGFPENETFDDFEQCVALRGCGGECGWGKNWGCRGNYSWPAPRDPSHLPYALELRSTNSSSGHVARVAACPAGFCDQPIDEARSDAWGQVEIDVGSVVGALEFIWIDFGEQVVAAYGPPVFRETSEVMAANVKVRPEYAALGGPEFQVFADPASTLLGLKALDCAGAPAPGVSFELVGDTGGQPFVWAGGFPTFLPETTTDGSGSGGFAGLAEGTVGIRVRGSGGQRLASRDGVLVGAGQVTMVALFPDTTEGD